jgi:hypothetical protein
MDIPCICGHEENAHHPWGPCSFISFPFSGERHSCGCAIFVRFTNLEWLEIKAQEKVS